MNDPLGGENPVGEQYPGSSRSVKLFPYCGSVVRWVGNADCGINRSALAVYKATSSLFAYEYMMFGGLTSKRISLLLSLETSDL